MAFIELDRNSFKNAVYQEDTPILVWFSAMGSNYCQIIRPLMDQLAKEYDGKVNIGRVDMDREEALVYLFDINEAPTFLLFKDCEIAKTGLGELTKEALIELIES